VCVGVSANAVFFQNLVNKSKFVYHYIMVFIMLQICVVHVLHIKTFRRTRKTKRKKKRQNKRKKRER
jgi:amino acid permease